MRALVSLRLPRGSQVTKVREYVVFKPRVERCPDIAAQPVGDVTGLRSVRRKPVVTGLINEYHHAA